MINIMNCREFLKDIPLEGDELYPDLDRRCRERDGKPSLYLT